MSSATRLDRHCWRALPDILNSPAFWKLRTTPEVAASPSPILDCSKHHLASALRTKAQGFWITPRLDMPNVLTGRCERWLQPPRPNGLNNRVDLWLRQNDLLLRLYVADITASVCDVGRHRGFKSATTSKHDNGVKTFSRKT